MKASKLIAAVVSGAAALALVGGIAYAIEPDRDPATLPMPEAAQGTSIAKQVASIIVYEDQEEAVAMASEFDDIHDELALDAVSSRASLSAKHSASHDATAKTAASAAGETPEGSDDSIDVEAVDVTEPLETISPEGDEMVADSIDVNGDIVTYVPSYESASAPVPVRQAQREPRCHSQDRRERCRRDARRLRRFHRRGGRRRDRAPRDHLPRRR